ncbi:MAG: stage III sporulation protein AB [Bacillota bacterium]|nr:stage III sporulation protein AB [Bacillota bacterium]
MVKVFICVMVFSCSYFIGHIKASVFKSRRIEIENTIELIKLLEIELTYRRDTLVRTLEKVSELKQGWTSCLFKEISIYMQRMQSLDKAWETTLAGMSSTCPLNKEDIAVLNDVFAGLGKSDIDSQKKLFKPALLRLTSNYETALKQEEKYSRLYKTMGSAVGAVMVITVI